MTRQKVDAPPSQARDVALRANYLTLFLLFSLSRTAPIKHVTLTPGGLSSTVLGKKAVEIEIVPPETLQEVYAEAFNRCSLPINAHHCVLTLRRPTEVVFSNTPRGFIVERGAPNEIYSDNSAVAIR